MNVNPILRTFLFAALMPLAGVQAQEAKPDKIFSDDSVLSVTLSAPWRTITRENRQGQTWNGTFSFTEAGGGVKQIPVVVSRRGLTRARICDFPPLRIGFDKEAAKGTAFRGAGNLKLVTHCFRSTRYDRYYLEEYLSYRLYNLVTPVSFRVQGLEVRYVDSEGKNDDDTRFAFLIEDPDDIAERNGLQKLEIKETKPSTLDPLQTNRYMLFQYLIGNLDWSVLSGPGGGRCCHNARVFGPEEGDGRILPVPYDLDFSGLIDAHYAAPPANLRVRDLRDRTWRGFCAHNDAIPGALDEYRALKPQILALFQDDPRLDERTRKDALRFLEGFYQDLADERDVRKNLIDNCRG